MDEQYISRLVESVIKAIDGGNVDGTTIGCTQKGVFDTMTEALEAVQKAYPFWSLPAQLHLRGFCPLPILLQGIL